MRCAGWKGIAAARAILASSLNKSATGIRHLQRTEVDEAEESFAEGQKGSSVMPHKRNLVKCERVCGLSRLVRGYVVDPEMQLRNVDTVFEDRRSD